MLQFFLKAFAVGTLVAPLLAVFVLVVRPNPQLLPLTLFVWPTGFLMAGDAPGITFAGVALLFGVSALGNGLVYGIVATLFREFLREPR